MGLKRYSVEANPLGRVVRLPVEVSIAASKSRISAIISRYSGSDLLAATREAESLDSDAHRWLFASVAGLLEQRSGPCAFSQSNRYAPL
jgi:hypothetical protein